MLRELIERKLVKRLAVPSTKKKNISYAAKHLAMTRMRAKRTTTKLGGPAGAKIRKYWGLEDSIDSIIDGAPLREVIELLSN